MARTFRERVQKKIKAKEFIGRETELALFEKLIAQDEPEYLVLLVHGIGGVGKTWLLNQWQHLAKEKQLATARVNESQHSVDHVLKKLRDDLVEKGSKFKEFDTDYEKFRHLKSEAEKALGEWENLQEDGLAKTAGRFTGKSIAVIARLFSPSREALEFFGGGEKLEKAFSEGFSVLRKRFKNKEDLDFLENPLLHLTRSFVKDLNGIYEKERVILFFDTYEYLSPFCDEWLCKTFLEEELSSDVMLVFAGRDQFSSSWLDFHSVIRQIPLKEFSDEEAREYLKARHITDEAMVKEILAGSGKLPVFMAMLTVQTGTGERETATGEVVERFLKWIPKKESVKRRAVICCAFPRCFNKDIVSELLGENTLSQNGEDYFDWLIKLPFISSRKGGWVYHDVVRQNILKYKLHESPREFEDTHKKLLDFFRQQPGDKTLVEELYHLLSIDIEKGNKFVLAGILNAFSIEESLINWLLKAEEVVDQVGDEMDVRDRIINIKNSNFEVVTEALQSENTLKQIAEEEDFPAAARSESYLYLGDWYDDQQRFEEAEKAYGKAIELKPDYEKAYVNLGVLLDDQQRFEEAEEAYGKAIELKPDDADAYFNLGNLLNNQQRFEEVEKAYGKAIELKPDDEKAYGNLGNLLFNQQRFEEAEKAYGKAIELKPDDEKAYVNLGNLLFNQQRFEEAEKAYGKAIELKPDDEKAYFNLGVLYNNQQRFNEAEKAYRKAIELNPQYASPYYNMACLYALKEDVEHSVEFLQQSIQLDSESRTIAQTDSDFDKIKQEPAFQSVINKEPEF